MSRISDHRLVEVATLDVNATFFARDWAGDNSRKKVNEALGSRWDGEDRTAGLFGRSVSR